MKFESRNPDNQVLCILEAESLQAADAYGLAHVPGHFRCLELPEGDVGLKESWRRRHPEWTEQEILTAATGHSFTLDVETIEVSGQEPGATDLKESAPPEDDGTLGAAQRRSRYFRRKVEERQKAKEKAIQLKG